MKYELLTTNEAGQKIYSRIDDDGLCRVTCTEDDAGYQEWLNPTDLQKPAKTSKVVDEAAPE